MTERTWLPLPTHDGFWWIYPLRCPDEKRPIEVTMKNGVPTIGGVYELHEIEGTVYAKAVPPPPQTGGTDDE